MTVNGSRLFRVTMQVFIDIVSLVDYEARMKMAYNTMNTFLLVCQLPNKAQAKSALPFKSF